jgi:hypothetical protein
LRAEPPLPATPHVPLPMKARTTPEGMIRRTTHPNRSPTSTLSSGMRSSAIGAANRALPTSPSSPLDTWDPFPPQTVSTSVARCTRTRRLLARSATIKESRTTSRPSGRERRAATDGPPTPSSPGVPAWFTMVVTTPVVRLCRCTRWSVVVDKNRPSAPHTASPLVLPRAVCRDGTPDRATLPDARHVPLPAMTYVVSNVALTAATVHRVPVLTATSPLGNTATWLADLRSAVRALAPTSDPVPAELPDPA